MSRTQQTTLTGDGPSDDEIVRTCPLCNQGITTQLPAHLPRCPGGESA